MVKARRVAVVLGALLAAGCSWIVPPADEFDLAPEAAANKLAAVKINGEKREWYGTMGIDAKKLSPRKVQWISGNGMAHYECTIDLEPIDGEAEKTHVVVTCAGGGAGDGAAAGMTHNMFRNRLIDLVDATLKGWPLEKSANVSLRWPSDGVDGSITKAAGDALQMDRDMHKMQEEMKAQKADQENADAGYGSDTGDSAGME